VWLLDAFPLANGDLNAAMKRNPPMDPLDLESVLLANLPLTGGNMNVLIGYPTPLTSQQATDILLQCSPKNGDLNSLIDSPKFTDAQIRDVLIANSPLTGGVKNTLDAKVPPMNQADYDLVMAAQ
jgi:hypothetical protein